MKPAIKILIATIAISWISAKGYGQKAISNWKTYRSDPYGFTFQYPGEWVMDEDTDIVVSGKVTSRSIHFIDSVSQTFLLISYSLAKGKEIYDFYVANFDPAHSQRITVAGGEAIEITSLDNRSGRGELLDRKDWKKEIDIEFLDTEKTGEFELKFNAVMNGNLDSEVAKFRRLLSSFTFLNGK